MTTTFKKVFADLHSFKGRTLLVILALAIGIWGLGGILVSYTILTRDLSHNFTQTRPAHAILTSKDFGKLDLAALRKRAGIERAEFRDLSLQRIEVHPDEWITLWLFGVRDFEQPTMALLGRERGDTVPAPGTMLIERDGRLISNLDVGSRAPVRAGRRILDVPITGIVFDPAQAPATQDHFIYAYVDQPTYTALTGEPANQRLLLRLNHVTTKQEVQAAVDKLAEEFRARGIILTSINVPRFNEHPHQWQLNTLLFLQGSIGLLALLLGAVLVSQLMAAILAKQVRQIGILKAIGASSQQVLRMYLTMVLLMGVAAGLIAIPLAVSSGYAFSYFVAGKLNFEILTRHLPLYMYVALIVTSLLLPVLLSLPAIVKGIRVSVYDALSDYGISSTAGVSDRQRSAPAWMSRGLLLAVRNSLRQKKRLAVTVAAMAMGVAIFDTGFNVRASLATLLAEVNDSMRHDVQVVLKEQIPREQALPVFHAVGNVARIETWSGGRGELQSRVVATANGVGIVALPHDSGLFHPRITAGHWLRDSQSREVVMNRQAMELYDYPLIGGELPLEVGGQRMKVRLVGAIEELDKPKIYIDKTLYDAFANPAHQINSLMFVAEDKSYGRVMALKKDIEAAIAASDLNILYVMSQAERVKIIYEHLNIILSVIVFLSLLVLVVSALGMASATGINILERTREIGVLRAIGATPRMIFRLFVAEGMIVSGAGVALGLLLAWPLSKVAAGFFGNLMLGKDAILPYAFSAEGFLITLATTLAFGWLASRVPARRAIRVSARDALAYE